MNLLKILIFLFLGNIAILSKTLILEQDLSSIVRVKVTSQVPNFQFPWITKKPTTNEIIGILVKKNSFLVLASYVEYATSIEVQLKNNKNFSATVEKIDLDANLALIQTTGEIPNTIKPIQFEDKFDPKGEFILVNLDTFGNPLLSHARGISLNVEQQPTSHIELPYLNVNTNEKLDGIGELLFLNQKAIGILFKYQTNRNIGKVVPGFLINQFLENQNNKSTFAFMGFRYQALSDKATKEYYSFPYENGVIVSEVLPYSSAEKILKTEDIIFQIDNFKIDSQGNFEHPDSDYGKQPISFLLNAGKEIGFQIGSKVKLKVWRDKKELELKMKLKPFPKEAVQIPHANHYGEQPKFLVTNGFVFTELSEFLLKEWGNHWRSKVDKKLLYLLDYHKFHKKRSKSKIIVLVQVLPDEANDGYHNVNMEILYLVNGKTVKDLSELHKLLYESKEELVVLELDNGISLAIDTKKLSQVDEKIAKKFNIPQLKNL
ncbi:MAG: serine protease [Leptospiraceae bacterium]|nr:serine protease [Leptospiraceae bacterium]